MAVVKNHVAVMDGPNQAGVFSDRVVAAQQRDYSGFGLKLGYPDLSADREYSGCSAFVRS
jgi:hypothetical protein